MPAPRRTPPIAFLGARSSVIAFIAVCALATSCSSDRGTRRPSMSGG